jgi:hypothetical protein
MPADEVTEMVPGATAGDSCAIDRCTALREE